MSFIQHWLPFCVYIINTTHIDSLTCPQWLLRVQEWTEINSKIMLNNSTCREHMLNTELILELGCIQTTTCWCLSVSCSCCDTEEAVGTGCRNCVGVCWRSSLLGKMSRSNWQQDRAAIKELQLILDSCKLGLTPLDEVWPNLYIGNV